MAPGGEGARTVSLDHEAGRRAAASCIADFFDGDLADGLFHPRDTSPAHQDMMLASLDKVLPRNSRDAADGPEEGVTPEELEEALKRCERGKAPGCDGLTYEFYRAFWPVLGERLSEVFQAAFEQGDEGRLPSSMLLGIVTLVYKGPKAGPRTQLRCYRPLTMLNCDYKILAKAIACRLAEPLTLVVDDTQTAFLPGRSIVDNVLTHLEEVDYLEATQQPGVIAFVDFEKAYDKVSRPWAVRCMQAMGFGPRAVRWVRLLHNGTRAKCRFNGFHTREFPVVSGVAQGSPLSPALYVIAAQPLAARLRQLQRTGVIAGIELPDGTMAPPSHQHADDTTIHLRRLADLGAAWHGAVQPFCSASGSRAHPGKTTGMLLGSEADGRAEGFTDPASGVSVAPRTQAVRHLGVMLGPGRVGEEARAAKYAAVEAIVLQRIQH